MGVVPFYTHAPGEEQELRLPWYISRFESVGDFASYARLVKCAHESAGKRKGTGGAKIGNAHLKWAYSEAAVLLLRRNAGAAKLKARIQKRHGEGKTLSILAHKLGRASYFMLKRGVPFDEQRFLSQ